MKEVKFIYLKKAWFLIASAGLILSLRHVLGIYYIVTGTERLHSVATSVMFLAALILVAFSFYFFSQPEKAIMKTRHINLSVIIIILLVTITFTYNYSAILKAGHFLLLAVYVINTQSSIFLFVIGFTFYWMSIRRKKKKRKLVHVFIMSAIGLTCLIINIHYMPEFIKSGTGLGGPGDVLTTFCYMLIPAASWVESCFVPGSDNDMSGNWSGVTYVSGLERVMPGLSLLMITAAVAWKGAVDREFFFSYGTVILALLSMLIILNEWISFRSEEALIAILSVSPSCVQIIDRGMKRNYFVNKSLFLMFGSGDIPPDNILSSIYEKEKRKKIRESILKRIQISDIEADFIRPDGSFFTAQCRILPARYFSYSIVIIWMTDITERKRQEKALIEERNSAEFQSFYRGKLLDTLSSKMLSGYVVGQYYEGAGKGDLVFTEMNRQALEIMNSSEYLNGKRYTEIFPDYTKELLDSFYDVYTSGNSKRIELYSKTLRKNLLIVVFKTGVDEIALILNDVTGHKKVEKDLLERERELKSLMATLPGMVYRCRIDENFSFEIVSPGSIEVTGYNPEELVQNNIFWSDIIHPDDWQGVYTQFRESVESREYFNLEYRIINRSGDIRYVTNRGSSVKDGSGKVLFYQGLVMDVTASKKGELRLRENEERMRQSEKIRDIGQMAGGMAHDLNNKLMGISSYLSLIELKSNDPGIKKYSTGIHNIISESSDIIESVLTYARRINITREKFGIHSILERIKDKYGAVLTDRIRIETDLAASLDTIFGDDRIIRRAISGIVSNAVDAVEPEGKIIVTTVNRRREEDPALLRVEPVTNGLFILIKISDTGGGIEKENLSRVFDPFFTTKPPGRGRELGLSAVFGAIQSHGGLVTVESIEGEGTEFSIYLPCVES